MGGPAKSQLVHEVDALGGEIGKMADRTYVQKRILNRSKACALCLCYVCVHAVRFVHAPAVSLIRGLYPRVPCSDIISSSLWLSNLGLRDSRQGLQEHAGLGH